MARLVLAFALLARVAAAWAQPLGLDVAPEPDPMGRIWVAPDDPRPPPPAFVPQTMPPEQALHLLQGVMDDDAIVARTLTSTPEYWPTLSAPMQLVLADAYTRRGEVRKASKLYALVLERADGATAWAAAARSGLGWTAVARGDLDGVRRYFAEDAAAESRPLARVLVALLEAADARPGAPEALARLARDRTLSAPLREVAALGVGYAYLWAGAYAKARSAFGAVTERRFADDAAYGAAWSRHLEGDDDGAIVALRALATGASGRSRQRVSRRLVRLEAPAVMRVGLQGYRELHVATDEGWLVEMLDGDGAQLARVALKTLAARRPAALDAVASQPIARRDALDPAAPTAARHAPARAGQTSAPRTDDGGGGLGRLLLVLGAIALALLVFGRGRAPSTHR